MRPDHLNLVTLIKFTDVQSRMPAKLLKKRNMAKCVVMPGSPIHTK